MDQSAADIVIFFGRFHPLFLHLPIGFLVLAFVMEFVSRREKFSYLRPAIGFVLLFGAATALVTAVLGLMLARAGDYSEELLLIHQWAGIILVVMACTSWLLYLQKERKPSSEIKKAYVGSMVLMMVFLAGAGHYGGSLTHGSSYLTQYMPNGLRVLAGLPVQEKGPRLIKDLNEAEVFADIVHPILDMRCNSCHNASKKKGDLQMHTRAALMKGGENGPVFVAGNAAESEIIRRAHLPDTDDDHMPPKGKTQLTPAQLALLEWWINEGAPFDKKVAEVKADEEISGILQTLADPDANKTAVEKMLAAGVAPADPEKIKLYKSRGISVKPLSNNENWLQVTLYKNDPIDEILAQMSQDFPEQVTWLDLKDTPLSDAGMAHIGKFNNLTRLRAEKTAISDDGLAYLKELPYLEFLNIYATSVGDAGIQHLKGNPNLRRLYAWDSKVTKAGAAQLQESSGRQLEINLGFEVSVVDSLTVEVLPVRVKD